MRKASLYQAHRLWGICRRYGSDNIDWIRKAKSNASGPPDALSYDDADRILQHYDRGDYDAVLSAIRAYIPGFEWTNAPQPYARSGNRSTRPKPSIPSPAPAPVPPPEPEPNGPTSAFDWGIVPDFIPPECADEVATLVKAGVQLCLYGPSGCGKDALLYAVSKVLGKSFHQFSVSGGIRFSQLFYSVTLRDGNSEVTLQPLLRAIQDPNALVVLDEIMSIDEDIGLGLNSILEPSQRYIVTPIGTIHCKATIVATSNTSGRSMSEMYSGTKRQDESLISRFVMYPMDYSPQVVDYVISLLPSTAGNQVRIWYESLARKVREAQVPYDVSIRRLRQVVQLFHAGLPVRRAWELGMLGGLSDAERTMLGELI